MGRPRKFDYDEARKMYATGRFTMTEVARRFGVSRPAMWRVLDDEHRERADAESRRRTRERYLQPCIDGCETLTWAIPGRVGRCPACTAKLRRTAEHGTESRYSSGCRCDRCRRAASDAKRQRRIATRVPCSHGCGTLVDSINRRQPDKPPECVPCANVRVQAARRQSRTRVAA
jgi:hypothetical protein